MKKYDLVIKNCNSDGKYFDDENASINGKYLRGITNIDEYTSAFTLDEIYNSVLLKKGLDSFHSLKIRVVDGADISYQDIIVNNDVINSCVKDIDDKGRINKNNEFFKKELYDFILSINQYNLKIIIDCLIDKDNERLLNSIVEYKKDRNNNYLELVNNFSSYINFRKWILNKKRIKRNGIYDNHLRESSERSVLMKRFKGEFLTYEEIIKMLDMNNNMYGYVKSKKL